MVDDLTPPSSGDDGGSASDPLVGSILAGRYRILRHLGEGAMGAVYLGEHLKIGRHDAIKVLRPSLVRNEEAIARFARGARNASQIHHPNVCTVYDFAEADDDFWFLAMEYIDGEELGDLLEREGPLGLHRAVDLTIQIARALAAAHRIGIVHRDLKPGNVMVGRGAHDREVAKVVDFDIAKGSSQGEAANVTRMGFTIGTPEYMSPEQLMVDELDGRSDLYSLGLVFFKMVTGRLPFRGTTSNELMLERLNQDPLKFSDVSDHPFPERLQALLDRTLQRRPSDRPADAAAFMTELEDAVEGTAPTEGRGEARDPPEGEPGPDESELPATRLEPKVDPDDLDLGGTGGSRPRPAWVAPVAFAAAFSAVALGSWVAISGGGSSGEVPQAGATTSMPDTSGAAIPPGSGTEPSDQGGEGTASGDDPGSSTGGEGTTPDDPDGTGNDLPSSGGEPRLSPTEVADQLDRLTNDFLDDRITAQALRAGARRLYDIDPLPDSIQARVAYGAFVGATAVGEAGDACLWIRRAAQHAPGNDRYQALAGGCGG